MYTIICICYSVVYYNYLQHLFTPYALRFKSACGRKKLGANGRNRITRSDDIPFALSLAAQPRLTGEI